jgi:6-phosphogluconolactonase
MSLITLWRLRSPAVANATTLPFASAARATLIVFSLLALAACGGGGNGTGAGGNPPASTISVEGFVSGLAGSGLMLSNNGSDNLAVGTNGGFIFAKPLSNGDPYNVTIASQPNNPVQSCSILDGSGTGTVTAGNVTMVAVACMSAGHFLYTADTCPSPDDCISAYSIDATTGALTAVPGSPFPGGGLLENLLSVDPSSRFAFVADGGLPGVVLAYTIDHGTGALTAVAGSPFTAPMAAASAAVVAVDPSGNFLYVAGEGTPGPTGSPTASVSVFTIDTTSGSLSPLAEGPYATGPGPSTVALDPSGKFVYVGCITGNGFYISAFTRDATTGALTAVPGSPFLVQNNDSYLFALSATIIVNPNGKFLYVAGQGLNQYSGGIALNPSGTFAYSFAEILAYAIDPSSGALMALAGNPFGGAGLTAYAIDGSTGALTAVPDSLQGSLAENILPPIAVDPSGNFAYAQDSNGGISVFGIDTGTGALTAIAGSPFPGLVGGSMVVSK